MKREQFTFYRSYYEALKHLPKREQSAVLMAVIGYALDETEPSLSGVALSVFTLIRPTLDSGRIKAENRMNKAKTKQEQIDNKQEETKNKPKTKLEQNVKEGEKEKEREGEVEKEGESEREYEKDSYTPPVSPSPGERTKKKFVPPTLEEVAQYCRERNSSVDPRKFWEYFSTPDSQGRTWIDSEGKPVRNWKQKLLTWEKFNPGKQQSKPTGQTMNDGAWAYVRAMYSQKEDT